MGALIWMLGLRLDRWVRRAGHALSVVGGVHLYAAVHRNEEELRLSEPLPTPWPLRPPITLCRPAEGHPERLIPEVPYTEQEAVLARELAHLGWLLPGENRRR